MPLLSEYAMGVGQPVPRDEWVPSVESDAAAAATTGWLAGATRRVVSRSGQAAYGLEIADLARFVVAKSGGGIYRAGAAPGGAPAVLEEALLGPPLTFALALQEVWCLHASAVLKGGQAMLFLGASGDGKSTLAAYLNEAAPGGWRRLADDILPCVLAGGLPFARPHFPQLKLSPEERYPSAADEAVPVGAVVVLRPTRKSAEIALEPLVATAAVKALAEQTVAVSLFDRALHGAHLRFVAGLVRAVPVYRMCYPHDYERLGDVARVLEGI
ncbi:MAG: hypothetical protein WAT36_03155 [Chromatiaceae bacterium]